MSQKQLWCFYSVQVRSPHAPANPFELLIRIQRQTGQIGASFFEERVKKSEGDEGTQPVPFARVPRLFYTYLGLRAHHKSQRIRPRSPAGRLQRRSPLANW